MIHSFQGKSRVYNIHLRGQTYSLSFLPPLYFKSRLVPVVLELVKTGQLKECM